MPVEFRPIITLKLPQCSVLSSNSWTDLLCMSSPRLVIAHDRERVDAHTHVCCYCGLVGHERRGSRILFVFAKA